MGQRRTGPPIFMKALGNAPPQGRRSHVQVNGEDINEDWGSPGDVSPPAGSGVEPQ